MLAITIIKGRTFKAKTKGLFSNKLPNTKVVPSAELALLSMTEVVFGPFWVWLFLGETAGVYTLLGGMILLIAIASNALSGLRRKPIPWI